MNSAYDRAVLVGPVVLALTESLDLTTEQAVALAVVLAQQEPAQPTIPALPEETDESEGSARLTDGQLDSVVRSLMATHRPDSYRQMRATFRATKHRAGEGRLRAAWARITANP